MKCVFNETDWISKVIEEIFRRKKYQYFREDYFYKKKIQLFKNISERTVHNIKVGK